jgi:hypothetical protein
MKRQDNIIRYRTKCATMGSPDSFFLGMPNQPTVYVPYLQLSPSIHQLLQVRGWLVVSARCISAPRDLYVTNERITRNFDLLT